MHQKLNGSLLLILESYEPLNFISGNSGANIIDDIATNSICLVNQKAIIFDQFSKYNYHRTNSIISDFSQNHIGINDFFSFFFFFFFFCVCFFACSMFCVQVFSHVGIKSKSHCYQGIN